MTTCRMRLILTKEIISKLETDTIRLLNWFEINYFKMNADKCKLLITNHENEISVSIDGNIIDASKSVKLLGIKIDKNLDFNEHVSTVCKKVNLKLHALARISQFMDKDKLRIVMKAFIVTIWILPIDMDASQQNTK